MKKLFLFIGVIIWVLLFSCKKDSPPPPPPPPIDSFLLHPPPVTDSLPIPLTIGTWWKYQRVDSSNSYGPFGYNWKNNDSSIELITVIGKTPFVDVYYEFINNIERKRYDTVNAFMLEVKNLTKGTLDTIHAFYNNAFFYIIPNTDTFYLYKQVQPLEGTLQYYIHHIPISGNTKVVNNSSVSVLNMIFDNCIYTVDTFSYNAGNRGNGTTLKNYLKPSVGFVYWEYVDYWYYYYDTNTRWYYRRLIDYHIAP